MTPDCVFEGAGGNADYDVRSVGFNAIRERFVDVWNKLSNVDSVTVQRYVRGSRGCSEWMFRGVDSCGHKFQCFGGDLFTFRDCKIRTKMTHLKQGTAFAI